MTKFEGKFTYFPVGQGLFYFGKITFNNNSFKFIYDCGTESPSNVLVQCIESNEINEQDIDLLIISHFHCDHISGIKLLISKVKSIKTVIMPYLSPIERLILAAKYLVSGETTNNLAFSNPASYLLDIAKGKISNIIYLIKGEDNISVIAETSKPIDTSNDNLLKFNWQPIEAFTKDFLKEYINGLPENCDIKLDSQLFFSAYYEFVFYVNPISTYYLNKFESKLLKDNIDTINLHDTICNNFEKLQETYKNTFTSNLNFTTLVCYHGIMTNHDDNFAHLLLGDIQFKKGNYSNFIRHYENRKEKVKITLIPHHGSSYVNITELLNDFQRSFIWVCCYGIGNRHHHPSENVINEILLNDKGVILLNQFSPAPIITCFIYDFKNERYIWSINDPSFNEAITALSIPQNRLPLMVNTKCNISTNIVKSRFTYNW